MLKKIAIGLLVCFTISSCQDDLDDVITPASTLEINDFIWKAMNAFYLYKPDSPNLADDSFTTNEAYANYLNSFATPEGLFNDLLAQQDRFSIIVDNYVDLENSLDGINFTTGMQFGLVNISDSNSVFGFVRYVVPNSPASEAGIERGMLFNRVNGETLTPNTNFNSLFGGNNYTIGLAEFDGTELSSLSTEISLSKIQLTENPIYSVEVIEVDNTKVGYLMYNAFRSNFDSQLNTVFANFKSENIDELILDLRYNSGGSIETAKDLASMVTGQFEGEIFAFEHYNDNFNDEELRFDNQIRTGANINSLNLNRVYILTGFSTASASELVINALKPYINVVQIGQTTVGKFEGSVTLYDSANFRRDGASINHFYAIQPLILKTANANGVTDYFEGLAPDITLNEDYTNLGVIGNQNEPLLNRALEEMGLDLTEGKPSMPLFQRSSELLFENQSLQPTYQRMYIEKN
ncbi:S41 family peptidase [Psychroflexus sp. ALD_RP9]|uniref:S41 family peptidase n=1 Tax=Psychroflexus sp. ALD_RP9 TaxID=2777186 RepID=UPI001A8EE7A1|nr:S41 family peptidase [Psychroflexus sp. ALD_RP9]QSS97229.1 peptidase S41 [Psychroflexus sp. ALD_RP9]